MTLLPKLSAPAARALVSVGIQCLEDLENFTWDQIVGLHGLGEKSIISLEVALQEAGLRFKS